MLEALELFSWLSVGWSEAYLLLVVKVGQLTHLHGERKGGMDLILT